MGNKDTLTKAFMSDPGYFADAFNASVFGGRQVVKADELSMEEMDSTELGIVFEDREKDIVQKVRDVLKKCIIMQENVLFLRNFCPLLFLFASCVILTKRWSMNM